ncbi:hypothetical protein DPMN_043979 [Dreissena polymorpha]|uniref:E3 UFM1-protein ligase 1-like domain-containing protein n=1 Tax=Dreissena polymorpha TaxID=45954 RepID=A0A9D4D241_DREPO|nr:hypothetical protein DPMN_043979 [Dreissena polymorpha]
MKRQGISDPKDFIRKRFPGEPIVYLSTCCVGRGIQDGVETAVEEALETGTWVDIKVCECTGRSDASSLLTGCLRKHPGALVCCDTIVASEKLISQCSKPFPDLMAQKAEKDAKSHPVFKIGADGGGETRSKETKDTGGGKSGQTKDDRKDQRRQKAVAGSGSTKTLTGTQGREIKTKSLKKKGHKSRDDLGSDEEVTTSKPKSRSQEIEFMTLEEIEGVLRKEESLKECPEELVAEIAQQLLRPLTKQYQEVAHSVFLQSTGTAASRKKTHGQLQDRLTALWTNARLFEKGLKLMPEDVQEQLVRHLLRTVCTDITNLVLNAVATDHMHSVEDETLFTTESRLKLIPKLPEPLQTIMGKLNSSLNGKSLDEFFGHLDLLCGPAHLGILLRKPDKKKEKQVTLHPSSDPAGAAAH